jgi:hypothetical protein
VAGQPSLTFELEPQGPFTATYEHWVKEFGEVKLIGAFNCTTNDNKGARDEHLSRKFQNPTVRGRFQCHALLDASMAWRSREA